MWNHSKSLQLTAWWIRIALIVWIGSAVLLPFFSFNFSFKPMVLVIFYLAFVPITAALYGLDRMLGNIRHGKVFDQNNVAQLRMVSWACFFAAVILLVSACFWPVLILASGVIGFLGLFVRVIKNILAEAILIKEENDFTI